MRYEDIAAELAAGRAVTIYPKGQSMTPIIESGQRVVVRPEMSIRVGDAVFARVKGRYMLHKVTAIDGDRFQIGNNLGHINGWTKQVYGKVTEIG